jgi:hypothetical protein
MAVYRPEERRLVLRLMAYWDDLRDEKDYPAYGDLKRETIGDDWSHCYVLRVGATPNASTFEHVGELFRPDLPEAGVTQVSECPHGTLLHAATHYIDRVLTKRVPISLGGQANLGAESVLYRSILLPLSSDGHEIDYLLGAANYREVAMAQDDES